MVIYGGNTTGNSSEIHRKYDGNMTGNSVAGTTVETQQ